MKRAIKSGDTESSSFDEPSEFQHKKEQSFNLKHQKTPIKKVP
jgi:hypothetical protein